MDVKDVAERLQLHPTSVRRYIRTGRLQATATPTPQGIRYDVSEEALLQFEHNQSKEPELASSTHALSDITQELTCMEQTWSERLEAYRKESYEVWRALENLTRLVEGIEHRLEAVENLLSSLHDQHVKERDQQLVYTMKALHEGKKRKGFFSRA